jgi:hypothetical protein
VKSRVLWLLSLLALALIAPALLYPFRANAASVPATHPTAEHLTLNPTSNLIYHNGRVMVGTVTAYAIFWEPTGSHVSKTYNSLILQYFNDVGSSPLYHDLTQYYNKHHNRPSTSILGGSWVDIRAYPGPHLQETDIQREVRLAMYVNNWTPSIHKIFFVFSAKGEIMCSNLSNYGCTFINTLCAWHNFVGSNTIYAAMPYLGTDLSLCGTPSSPNHDIDADSEINVITHEQFEAATDPLYTAWYASSDSYHSEIGDLCAWQFGNPNKYGGDVVWNGHPYEVQKEWDNATSSCVLRGP